MTYRPNAVGCCYKFCSLFCIYTLNHYNKIYLLTYLPFNLYFRSLLFGLTLSTPSFYQLMDGLTFILANFKYQGFNVKTSTFTFDNVASSLDQNKCITRFECCVIIFAFVSSFGLILSIKLVQSSG